MIYLYLLLFVAEMVIYVLYSQICQFCICSPFLHALLCIFLVSNYVSNVKCSISSFLRHYLSLSQLVLFSHFFTILKIRPWTLLFDSWKWIDRGDWSTVVALHIRYFWWFQCSCVYVPMYSPLYQQLCSLFELSVWDHDYWWR